ncbi:MAG TPA: hypothetical protein VIO38_00515 [Rariglobus sp.]
MPSPREILLARHRSVEPLLDALRANVLAGETGGRRPVLLDALRTLWRELIAPCRPAWMTLAGVWVVLLVLNGAGRPVGETARTTVSQTAMVASWREQRRLLAELAASAASAPVNEPTTNRRPDHSFFRSRRASADRAC